MVINWSIPTEQLRSDASSLRELAQLIMPLFGMDAQEYRVRNGIVEGSPDALRFNRFITVFRLSVYDVKLVPDGRRKRMNVKFRLYKGLVLAVLIWLVNGLLLGSMWKWESLVLPVLALLFFNGLTALFIVSSKSAAVRLIQRWGGMV